MLARTQVTELEARLKLKVLFCFILLCTHEVSHVVSDYFGACEASLNFFFATDNRYEFPLKGLQAIARENCTSEFR